MINENNNYQCPHCAGALTLSGPKVNCTFCKVQFPVINGMVDFTPIIPHFLSGDIEYDNEMDNILENSRANGWYESLRGYDKSHGSLRLDYATSLSRIDFKFLLPLAKNACILDIGGGHGLISIALARTVAQVYTIEKIRSQAEFIAVRVHQEDIKNVEVACGGANCKFPYKSESFDLIVANGVFEWVGFETTFEKVNQQQEDFLLEIARMLKPGGAVWLTTKNKYSLPMIFTRTINNNFMPLVSILPNRVINFIVNCLNKGDYLSGLKSVNGYLNLFKSCGFKEKSVWVPLPSVRYPTEFVAFNNGHRFISPANYKHAGLLTRVYNMIAPWVMVKKTALNHAYILRKKDSPSMAMNSIIEKIASAYPEMKSARIRSLFCPQSSSVTSSIIANVADDKATFIIKLARYENSDVLSREKKMICDLKAIYESLEKFLPDIVYDGNIDGFHFLVMKHYPGNSTWSNRFYRGITRLLVRKQLLKQMLNILTELARTSILPNKLSFRDYVEDPFSRLIDQQKDLCDFSSRCLRILEKNWNQIPLIFTHGDLHLGNFIIQRVFPLQFKILDWESSSSQGLPCIDLHRFIESLHISLDDSAKLMKSYCKQLFLDPKIVGPVVFLHLVQSRERWDTENELSKTPELNTRNVAFKLKVNQLVKLSSYT